MVGAAIAVTKTITHDYTSVRDGVSGLIEVRATSPLVITDYRDSSATPLAHVITSGTVLQTGKDKTGHVRFFTTFAFSDVTFDRVHSTEPCIPVSGKLTMTTYEEEGGKQLKQVAVTYSSAPSASVAGGVDPSLSVEGDDANGTEAQWMLLHVDRRCDLKR